MAQDHFKTHPDPKKDHGMTKNLQESQKKLLSLLLCCGPMAGAALDIIRSFPARQIAARAAFRCHLVVQPKSGHSIVPGKGTKRVNRDHKGTPRKISEQKLTIFLDFSGPCKN